MARTTVEAPAAPMEGDLAERIVDRPDAIDGLLDRFGQMRFRTPATGADL